MSSRTKRKKQYGSGRRISTELFLAAVLATVAGCTNDTTGERIWYRDVLKNGITYSEPVQTIVSVGNMENLSAGEMASYQADRRYVHELVPQGVAAKLNLADPRQYRFALARLKIAGLRPETSPHAFESLRGTRVRHQKLGLRAGMLAPQSREDGADVIHNTHDIPQAGFDENGDLSTFAKASTWGGTMRTLLDLHMTDEYGYEIASPVEMNEWFGGTDMNLPLSSNIDHVRSLVNLDSTKFQLDMLGSDGESIEDRAAWDEITFFHRDVGAEGGIAEEEKARYAVVSVEAPIDTNPEGGDGLIKVCLDRDQYFSDCDHNCTQWEQVKLPLKGTIQIQSSHFFDSATVFEVKTELKKCFETPPAPGTDDYASCENWGRFAKISVRLYARGGECEVANGEPVFINAWPFWDTVELEGARTVTRGNAGTSTREVEYTELSWNMTGEKVADFKTACRMADDHVTVEMSVLLPLKLPGGTAIDYQTAYLRSEKVDAVEDETVPDHIFGRVVLRNSCVAAGTRVDLVNGTALAIEDVAIGAKTANPYLPDSEGATVTNFAFGRETKLMYRLEEESGHSVLVTEYHPMITPDRGPVIAKHLRVGDSVVTRAGPSRLVSVTRTAYKGSVYNLTVGTEQQRQRLRETQTTFYGNGFLMGDKTMQDLATEQEYAAVAAAKKAERRALFANFPQNMREDYGAFLASRRSTKSRENWQ